MSDRHCMDCGREIEPPRGHRLTVDGDLRAIRCSECDTAMAAEVERIRQEVERIKPTYLSRPPRNMRWGIFHGERRAGG